MQLNPLEISALIKEQIKNYDKKLEMGEVGTVLSVGDGIAEIYGLEDCMANELVQFENAVYAMA